MQNFNFHSHTYRCGHADFDYSDEEYVQDYIKNGFKKIAFTDHAPQKVIVDKRAHMRMGYEQRHEYYKSIENLQEKYAGQIEIQKGFEIEYIPDQVDNILELKKETDKLVLGQHFVYAPNKKDIIVFWENKPYTRDDIVTYGQYLKEAMEHGIPDIIAHPDVCFSGTEEFGELEENVSRVICENAEKYNIPLEINLNGVAAKTYFRRDGFNEDPFEKQVERLNQVRYPTRNFWKIAREYNIKVVYGLDTHHRDYIKWHDELVRLANMVIGKDIIQKLNFIEDMK